jgi:hypothetical protein
MIATLGQQMLLGKEDQDLWKFVQQMGMEEVEGLELEDP